MSVLKAFTFSLVAASILAVLAAVGGVPAILFVAIFGAIVSIAKGEKTPRVFIKNDGFQYKTWLKDYVAIKWSEIASVAFEYADHPDSDSYWNFKMLNGMETRVTVRKADQEILLQAMARTLEVFCYNHPALMESSRKEFREENENGYLVIHCWESKGRRLG